MQESFILIESFIGPGLEWWWSPNIIMSSKEKPVGEFHGYLLTATWFALLHCGLWSVYFKHTRYGSYLHGVLMGFVVLLMAAGSLLIIGDHGMHRILNTSHVIHNYVGLLLLVLTPCIIISGSICKFGQSNNSTLPAKVAHNNKWHSIFGWSVILISKFPFYSRRHESNFILFLFILVDLISYGLFLSIKFNGNRLEDKHSAIQSNKQRRRARVGSQICREVRNERQLDIYHKNYFIFEDYVYSLSNVLVNHPGGSKVIECVRGREVDRFLYGCETVDEYPDTKAYSHSLRSIQLAGDPIALIKQGESFSNIHQFNDARIHSVDKIARSQIYELVLTVPGLTYNGYHSLEDLGKYYSVSLNGSITRLYTMVNFLQPSNLKLLATLMKTDSLGAETTSQKNLQSEGADGCIPLLMKKYEFGKFTSEFLIQSNFQRHKKLIVSRPRGFGLGFCPETPAGEVYFISGGTGLYPFCDTIDLLYKSLLVQQGHPLSRAFIQNDPILDVDPSPFQKFTFFIYISVRDTTQLHPITLYQCDELAKHKKLKCYIKSKLLNTKQFETSFPSIKVTTNKFEQVIHQVCERKDLSQIMVCGPTKFTMCMKMQLQAQRVHPSKYRLL